MVEKPETEEVVPEDKTDAPKLSVLEETKKAIADLKIEKAEMAKIRDDLQQLRSDNLLSGTGGGHIEAKKIPEEKRKANEAAEFFKGSQLEKDINKANE